MDLAKLVSVLANEALYFPCPNEFEDPFEGFYPISHTKAFSALMQNYLDQMLATRDSLVSRYPGINKEALINTVSSANEAFRKAFDEVRLKFGVTCWHKSETESAALWKLYAASGQGIAIESTSVQLRASLSEEKSLVVDDVRYLDFENDEIQKGHKHYGLFLKRKSFEHERELRATILLGSVLT